MMNSAVGKQSKIAPVVREENLLGRSFLHQQLVLNTKFLVFVQNSSLLKTKFTIFAPASAARFFR